MPQVEQRGYFRIDLADNCNIRCIMCQAYNSMPVSAMNFLDFDTFVAQTRGELAKWTYIQLGNAAEATIHPRFPDFVRYIRSEAPQSYIYVVTNAKTLHKYASLINDAGRCIIQVSMDSVHKKTHEYIREGSGFERAIENLSLLDTSRTQVLVSFTLMRSNVQEYPEMTQFCKERGFEMSVFPMILRSENGVIPYNLLRESLWFDLEHLRIWLEQFYGKNYGVIIGAGSGASPYVPTEDQPWRYALTHYNTEYEFFCNAHYQDLSMDSRGVATLCGKLSLGLLSDTPLGEIWHSAQAGDFRMQVENGRVPCMTCDYRQRCLAPSMGQLDNHFSEELVSALSPETRQAIRYERTISDEEAQWLFVRDVSRKAGIFEIAGGGREWIARKVSPLENPGGYRFSDPLPAASRHELHEIMRTEADSGFYVQFLEPFGAYNLVKYRGKYWALPLVLGHLNITRENDREKPGILLADTLAELKSRCGPPEIYEPPRLLESLNGYNLVASEGKFWAIPLAFGPYDITRPENQTREGIKVAHSLEHLREICGPFQILSTV